MKGKGRGWHGDHVRHSLAAQGRRSAKFYSPAPKWVESNRRDLGGFIRSQTLENGKFFYREHGDAFVMESGHATEKAAKKRAALLRKDGWDAYVLPNGETVVVKVNEWSIVEQNAEANWRAWREAQRIQSPLLETVEKGYMRAMRKLYDLKGQKAGEQAMARIKRR